MKNPFRQPTENEEDLDELLDFDELLSAAAELKKERDRYRIALERIVKLGRDPAIARAALRKSYTRGK
jgi:hypothetical protein